jgi:hypothetical protein
MSTPSQPKHRIFISHSHIDNEFGTRLAQDLCRVVGDESAVWYDVLGGPHPWRRYMVGEDFGGVDHTQGVYSCAFA